MNLRWGGLMARYPSFLGLGLQRRVAVALLELSLEFGVQNTPNSDKDHSPNGNWPTWWARRGQRWDR